MGQVERIFALLKEKGIEQKAFAAAIGVSEDTISNWKHGKSQSYTRHSKRIAEVLGTSVEYLLTGSVPAGSSGDLSAEDREILRQIHDRPGMRLMFSLTSKATDKDVERASKVVEALLQMPKD